MPYNSTSWKQGQSGNLTGRPKGTKNSRRKEQNLTILLDAVDKNWPEIVDDLSTLAKQGDFNVRKLLSEYVLPKQKASGYESDDDDDLDLDGLDTPEKRRQAHAIILEAQLKIHELCLTTH
ncbi:DUF5681 domain-containing protein [Candidatus Finniella inopinata]|uniref:DUF5681 domain-containing protein n=1 Tax=Candidatus Finniella inopinata TaxID=1696036 RepID=A0A4Q7DGD9_9PROT|nr:DUF5681 domain-containing protein [Candidatus Finniella inopinata]RZI45119.1 hypothetical protein EQU50_08265 [Candidatus Finniella inopinata]